MILSDFVAGFWRLKNWGMSSEELVKYVEKCVELGVTTMDHAMVYGSEAPFGRALALNSELREQIQIVSKCGIRPCGFGPLGASSINHYDSSERYIMDSVEASLKQLGTEYVDVLLIHRPDYLMDVDEVAEAFEQLKNQGKVCAFGVSNFTCHQFETLQHAWKEGLVTNQIEFSPLAMSALDDGTLDQCVLYNIQPMMWSCLAAGKILSPTDEKGERVFAALKRVADEVGADTVEQVVYAWALALPSKPRVLLGSSKIARIESAVKARSLQLNREHWYHIWEAANGSPVP